MWGYYKYIRAQNNYRACWRRLLFSLFTTEEGIKILLLGAEEIVECLKALDGLPKDLGQSPAITQVSHL